jgi:hypothetical protein
MIPSNSHEIQPSTTNWVDCICVVLKLIFSYVTNAKLLRTLIYWQHVTFSRVVMLPWVLFPSLMNELETSIWWSEIQEDSFQCVCRHFACLSANLYSEILVITINFYVLYITCTTGALLRSCVKILQENDGELRTSSFTVKIIWSKTRGDRSYFCKSFKHQYFMHT